MAFLGANVDPVLKSESKIKHFQQMFFRAELEALLNFAMTCKKTAVVLPNHLCQEFMEVLRRPGRVDGYAGLEKYYDVKIGVIFNGLVPQSLFKRVKHVERSGIWKRWEKIIKGSDALQSRM